MYFIPAFTPHSYECTSSFVHYYAHIYEDPQTKYLFLEDWVLPEEIRAGTLELSLFQELYSLNPTMKLSKSDPSTYDNSSTLASNLLKNKQRPTSAITFRTNSASIKLRKHYVYLKITLSVSSKRKRERRLPISLFNAK